MELLEMMQNRRSVRKYKEEPVPEEALEKILYAALLSASGKAVRPWEFITVQDKAVLKKMAECRAKGAQMLEGAGAAVVVLAHGDATDVWVEDCSIAMANMLLMADSLGLGGCWIQGRLREAADGRTTENFLRDLLGFPADCHLEAILSVGVPESHPAARELSELPLDKIHRERYGE